VFLFILESIGTSELLLIGIIALIFLGPRKLPQIARTVGKMMSEFRNTTNEFKSTWEREVNFQEEADALRSGDLPPAAQPSISRAPVDSGVATHELAVPEIKPAPSHAFEQPPIAEDETRQINPPLVEDTSDKKSWL
jgi:sec-independent protein translocase protein TatB